MEAPLVEPISLDCGCGLVSLNNPRLSDRWGSCIGIGSLLHRRRNQGKDAEPVSALFSSGRSCLSLIADSFVDDRGNYSYDEKVDR